MKRKQWRILFTVMLVTGILGSGRGVAVAKRAKKERQPAGMEIFLLIGQSNMAGRAVIENQDQDTLKNVFLFTGEPGNEWEKAANPLNKYSTVRKNLNMQRLGPGYTFARTIAAASPGKKIGLVVNARGGTALAEWMPGTLLYTEAVKRTKMAMKYGTLKGIIWHQGEADIKKVEEYREQIPELIQAFRQAFKNPELPFVAGQLWEGRPERAAFNRMIVELPQLVAVTGVATAEGTATTDSTHFDSKSQRLLGERYAAEMLELIRK